MSRRLASLLLGAVLACSGQGCAREDGFRPLFDGETLGGWEGDAAVFRVEDGAIVAGSLAASIPHNAFLCTTRTFRDFELRLEARLVGQGDNAGIQFRSRRLPGDFEVSGYQADMGSLDPSWLPPGGEGERADSMKRIPIWGFLYDESRRNRFLAQPEDAAALGGLQPEAWNAFVIRAEGPRIEIRVNGVRTADYVETEPGIPDSGVVCLQIHGGKPAEAWYRDITLKEIE